MSHCRCRRLTPALVIASVGPPWMPKLRLPPLPPPPLTSLPALTHVGSCWKVERRPLLLLPPAFLSSQCPRQACAGGATDAPRQQLPLTFLPHQCFTHWSRGPPPPILWLRLPRRLLPLSRLSPIAGTRRQPHCAPPALPVAGIVPRILLLPLPGRGDPPQIWRIWATMRRPLRPVCSWTDPQQSLLVVLSSTASDVPLIRP